MSMISIKNVSLAYTIHHDKTTTLKEYVLNILHKRSFVEKKKDLFWALDDINIEVSPKERLSIIGKNGAGKSTLLKVISGILKPTKGAVHVNGSIQPLIEIAAGFNPEFSGRENIYLNGYMLGFTRDQIRKKEQEIIEFSELGEFIDVPVKYYSSGMAVRLAFTIATSVEPEILLFDEMLSAGDASFIKKAKARIDLLVDRAKCVVVVSHDLGFVRDFSTRIVVLSHGKIAFDGSPQQALEFYEKI